MIVLGLVILVLARADATRVEAVGTTFVVNQAENSVSQGDGTCDETCTLREAITAANINDGADTITFSGAGGDQTVYPSRLPEIDGSDGITIDGSGADVLIAGFEQQTGPFNGLVIATSPGTRLRDVTIRNIRLVTFDYAILICGGIADPDPDYNQCTYDVSGVTIENVAVEGNSDSAVRVSGAAVSEVDVSLLHVAHTAASPAANGLEITALGGLSDVTARDSMVSDAAGSGFVIFGETTSRVDVAGNTVSDTGGSGLFVSANTLTTDVTVTDNALTNVLGGIDVWGTPVVDVAISDNQVSSSAAGLTGINVQTNASATLIERNVVEGASYAGIVVNGGPNALGNVVQNNTSRMNAGDGILVSRAQTKISRNVTHGNGQLGIDLIVMGEANPGVTLNDVGDGDSYMSNPLLNFPILTGGDSQAVSGTTCANCLVELFLADNDPTGYGEGQQFLRDATANGSGAVAVSICGLNLLAGTKLTTTATDPLGNTSEFSLNYSLPQSSGSCPSPSPTQVPSPTVTPTPGPSLTPAPTASPTPTAMPTGGPTGTPSGKLLQGDVQCDGDVDTVDALQQLRDVAKLETQQENGCPPVGLVGDVDCDGEVDSVDALKVLRHVAALSVTQTEPCVDIGDPL